MKVPLVICFLLLFSGLILKSAERSTAIPRLPKQGPLSLAQSSMHVSLIPRCRLRKAALFAIADVTFRFFIFFVNFFFFISVVWQWELPELKKKKKVT